jgi:hypothetical protein
MAGPKQAADKGLIQEKSSENGQFWLKNCGKWRIAKWHKINNMG